MGSGKGPRLVHRAVDAGTHDRAITAGYSPLQARVIAGRLKIDEGDDLRQLVNPSAQAFDAPHGLPDAQRAANLIADCVQQAGAFALVTDHDADGATSHAILLQALLGFGVARERIRGYLSHRLDEGYGVSDALVDRMLPALDPGSCIITADQGSTDEPRIRRLKSAGHRVIVTDHHGIPEDGPPASADAVVSPMRADSRFPDRSIAGCHTALLVMVAAREVLIARGVLDPGSPRISRLLDYAAVGTVADASSMARSKNNRLVVLHGLKLMNAAGARPCWVAMRRLLNRSGPWTVADLGFQIATRINARGRMSEAGLSVDFLCSNDPDAAFQMLLELDANNRERRTVERSLTTVAAELAEHEVAAGRVGLCLWLGETSHAGVHGITANRIVERFGRPTVCLSPVRSAPQLATGSIRTTSRVHVAEALAQIRRRWPGLLISGGGHRGAGGLRLERVNIPALVQAWDEVVSERYADSTPGPVLWVDGTLDNPSREHAAQLAALEPYGREFDAPLFEAEWWVDDVRRMGDGTHLRLGLRNEAGRVEAVWFSAAETAAGGLPVEPGQRVRAAYSLDLQTYRGVERLQVQIRSMIRLPAGMGFEHGPGIEAG